LQKKAHKAFAKALNSFDPDMPQKRRHNQHGSRQATPAVLTPRGVSLVREGGKKTNAIMATKYDIPGTE
jgi:hypothetical protein